MSIKAMNAVWEHSKAGGTLLLLQIALADMANDSGLCWPGLDHLAHKIRMSRRHVIRMIDELEELGEVIMRKNEGPKGCNLYILPIMTRAATLDHLNEIARMSPPVTPMSPHEGVTPASPPVTPMSPVTSGGGDIVTPEMSPEPSGTSATTTTGPASPPEPGFPEVEVPSEQEVIKFGAAYAGSLAKAIPPIMPERWCSNYWGWRQHRLKDWRGYWQKEMIWRFERQYQDGDPRTRPSVPTESKNGAARPSGGGSNGVWATRQRLEILRERYDNHSANENSSAYCPESSPESLAEFDKLAQEIVECENLLAGN